MAVGLYGLTGAVGALLVWVTIKPIVRRSPPWLPKPTVKLDWMAALRPRTLSRIGVALEHDQADAEILNRALGLAQTQASPSELVLLHVVDTAMTRVLGPETADRETGADERYLADLVAALRDRGYSARSVLLYGPDPAGELVSYLRHDPVDLLVVGSHGHGMVRDLLLGQTVDRVRHRLDVPMLIARPDRDGTVAGHPAAAGQPRDEVDLHSPYVKPTSSVLRPTEIWLRWIRPTLIDGCLAGRDIRSQYAPWAIGSSRRHRLRDSSRAGRLWPPPVVSCRSDSRKNCG